MYSTLISVEQLDAMIGAEELVIVDCRYDLSNPDAGKKDYQENHIPSAVYADVHDDLSGPPLTDSGRHPLPSPDALNQLFSRLGITHHSQVVVYDASGGAFAARLWWLLQYMGHEAVALLDGGWLEWSRLSKPQSQMIPEVDSSNFIGAAKSDWLILVEQVLSAELLIDSRDPARYSGEVEPIDPQAGHIPGAINHFWQNNLSSNGLFKSSELLKNQFAELFQDIPSQDVVFYCGSGVTACHNLLAVRHAGLDASCLYAGSWSEWCSNAERAVVKGNE